MDSVIFTSLLLFFSLSNFKNGFYVSKAVARRRRTAVIIERKNEWSEKHREISRKKRKQWKKKSWKTFTITQSLTLVAAKFLNYHIIYYAHQHNHDSWINI